MKFNKWTLGLAALGVVSLASAVRAEEKTYLETAVTGTQISGYVNTSAHWDVNGNSGIYNPAYGYAGGIMKGNGFNLDAVVLQLKKGLDETDWASGYNVQMVMGDDAAGIGNLGSTVGGVLDTPGVGSNISGIGIALKQAYVELRTPVGNGIDWKIGVFDSILGYESFDAGSNPNYTHSYGYTMEPTTHTGILASYKFCDVLSAQVGIANTRNTVWIFDRGINTSGSGPLGLGQDAQSRKTYMGSVALTAPNSWGVLAGSTLYGGVVKGLNVLDSNAKDYVNYYAGVVANTGVKGLKVGASYDYLGGVSEYDGVATGWADSVAVYASFQATDKLSLHARGEYFWQDKNTLSMTGVPQNSVYALTGTIQYDLWKNVLSRLEVRWDAAADTNPAIAPGPGSLYGSN